MMRAPLLVSCLLVMSGCAGSSASSSFRRAGDPSDVVSALGRMTPAPAIANQSGRPRVFLVATRTSGTEVAAVDLEGGRVVWRQTDDTAGRIAVARAAIVYARPNGSLVGRDGETGRLLWEHAPAKARRRLGYAADGDAVYEVTDANDNPRDVELVRLDARNGSTDWRVDLEGEAGAPVARGGLVALPRRSQYVSLIDGKNGRVLADILSREQAATFVRALPEGWFFGSRGIYLASSETALAARTSTGYLEAALPPFVRASYARDLYRVEQSDYTAVDRNRILWRADVSGPRARFAENLVVAHSFRFFFGIDAGTGALRWAYNHPREDAVAAERTAHQILFLANNGELGALDVSTGHRTWTAKIDLGDAFAIRGATFDAEGFAPAADTSTPAPSLSRALASILWDPDRRFMDVKLYAINELSRLQGTEVTADLLRALEAQDLPAPVVQRAVEALVDRRDPASAQLYGTALARRTDYTEDSRAPRLDVLARVVAVSKAREIVPALVAHLPLPETEPAAVRDIADAVLATGTRESVPAFQDYLMQYRADPGFAHSPTALLAAAEVMIKLGGVPERSSLLFVAKDARTVEPLRVYLERALLAEGKSER